MVGRYTAQANVIGADNKVLSSATTAFWAFPLWYTLGFIIVVLIIFFLIRFLKGRLKISVSLKK